MLAYAVQCNTLSFGLFEDMNIAHVAEGYFTTMLAQL
jgi:hypothetical protein